MVAEAEAAGVGANAVICSRLFALYAAEGQVRSALSLLLTSPGFKLRVWVDGGGKRVEGCRGDRVVGVRGL